jgi:hypothetical protein
MYTKFVKFLVSMAERLSGHCDGDKGGGGNGHCKG